MRLLLVNPRLPESFWSFRWALERIVPGRRALNPPLGLATLAALCPPEWEVTIVDENIEPLPLHPHADVVGVGGMAVQHRRQRELLRYYRESGCHVVAGGSFASLCPERLEGIADTVVSGEAERIWSEFCRDFAAGVPRRLYRETGTVDLAASPCPRFDLLDLRRYQSASIQFSRGCPYRCEFCDIIVMFGRRPRTKSPAQIGRELDRLRHAGARNVFFVDDNLIGHRPRAVELLRYLAEYQRRHRRPFTFGTETSLNLGADPELLALLRAAGFGWVFIGIESPDEESLRETGKVQNARLDLLSTVRRIHRAGIDVLAGFIVGFDHDTPATFGRQLEFIRAAGIQVAMVGQLVALPRTPLRARLEREGRLLPAADDADNTAAGGTNLTPKRMTSEELARGYTELVRALVSERTIAQRIRAKTRHLRPPVAARGRSVTETARILGRFVVRGLVPGGPRRWGHFALTLAGAAPAAWPAVVNDWIAGLALRDFVRRRFGLDDGPPPLGRHAVAELLRRSWWREEGRGLLGISLPPGSRDVVLTLRGALEPRFLRRAARRLERLLRESSVTLLLRVEHLPSPDPRAWRRFLRRLARHPERTRVHLARALRPRLGTLPPGLELALVDEPPGPPARA